ncbi:MAG: hypothetical protein NVSMB27_32970 [Ktedonobacteraceae bacterium]
MIMLTRKELGYLPGSMDAIYLRQDIDRLNMAWRSGQETYHDLLLASSEFETEARRLGVPDILAKVLIQRANIQLASGCDLEAITVLKEADQALDSLRQYDLKVSIYAGLAEAYAHLQDWQMVSAKCEQGITLVEKYRYKVSGPYLQSAYLRSRIGLYARGVQAAYERQEYPLMLQRAELSKCRSVLCYGEKSPVAAEEEIQTEQQFHQVCQQIDAARATGNAHGLDLLLAKRRTLWDLLLIQRAQARRGDPFPEFNLAAVQAALDDDEAVVYYYWLAPTVLLIVAIDRQEIIVEKCNMEDEREALEAFANFILSLKQGAYTYLDKVQRFSALLLPDKVKPVLEKKQRVIFSPHRLLHAFPLHALRWNDDYVIRHFAVSYIPNLSSLLVTYVPTPSKDILALGIQDFVVLGEQLNPLKSAELEVEALEELYNAQAITINILKGPRATKQNLQQWSSEGKLEQFRLLHFATHGADVRGDTPMESYLFLQDARLDGLEIADWRLNAELVVLSACHSGQRAIAGRGMPELPGDEIFGLQAAFFMAGARRVVGALWPVASQSACQIMTDFHRYLAAGKLPEVALQTAMIDYLATAPMKLTYFWAPFFISAIGRPSRANATLMNSRGTPD